MHGSARRPMTILLVTLAAAVAALAQEGNRPSPQGEDRKPPARGGSAAPADAQRARQDAAPKADQDESKPRPGRPPEAMIPNAEIAVVPIQHTDAEVVGKTVMAVRGAFEQPITATIDAQTNTLVIAASKDILPKVRDLITRLDQPRAGMESGHVCRSLALKNSSARIVADTLAKLAPRQGSPIVCCADDRTNTVWISGEAGRVAPLLETGAQMDSPTGSVGSAPVGGEAAEFCFFELKHADAREVVAVASQCLEWVSDHERDVHLAPLSSSGIVIAYVTPAQKKILETLIAKLDVPGRNFVPTRERKDQ